MKNAFLALFLTTAVAHAAPIFCENDKFHFEVANDNRTATLTLRASRNSSKTFRCEGYASIPEKSKRMFLGCVADDAGPDHGTLVNLYHQRLAPTTVAEVSAQSIAGPRVIATLSCVEAMNDRN